MPPEIYDEFDNHALVETSNDDGVIELYTCNRCGAVVRGMTMEIHQAWHAQVGH